LTNLSKQLQFNLMVKKITVFGAGAVGSTLAYNLLTRLKFDELVLIDINGDMANGVRCDLEDTRGFLNFSTKITAGKDVSLMQDSDIIAFTAGVARKEGMTRMDLLKINGKIAKDTAEEIKKYAPDSIVVAVTNPLDVITYIFAHTLGFARNRVIGMGSSLDTSRMLNLLFNETGVVPSSLEGYVFGAHSEDMIVSLDRVRVKGESLDCFVDSIDEAAMAKRVKLRGAEIVGFLKNRSAYFAPALSAACLIEAIACNKNEIIPVAVFLDGEYGTKDICMGVPCVINRKGIDKIIEIKLGSEEKKEIKKIEKVFEELRPLIHGGK